MKTLRLLLLPALVAAAVSCDPVKPAPVDNYKGLKLNEIAAHDECDEYDNIPTWVEIVNTGTKSISLEGLSIFVSDEWFKGQKIASFSGSLAPGERKVVSTGDGSMVTGVASNAPFTLVLGDANDNPTDTFERKAEDASLGMFASYQRMPDATGEWRKVTYSSPGKENYLFKVEDYARTAVWAWGSHLSDLVDNDGAKMRELKDKGYDHILMNYAGFEKKNLRQQAIRFIRLADEIGLVVHVWLQCFYDGGWISPIDDDKKAYKEEVFERIRNEATAYLEDWGVKGVHLDYIRFGGTAQKHNWTTEVNSVNAVNRCCREIREICDGYNEGLVTSAALMPEPNSSQYYGQKPADMAKYIHILMPMIYRYGSYNFSDDTFKDRSNYYADQAAKSGGVSWSGIQTYDAKTVGMTPEAMRKDIDLMAQTRCSGIVLFRYQLGTFPDIKDLWR